MREPPAHLAAAALRACLRADYGLEAAELTFLPLGHDASAWVYRVQATDGNTYFLKVRLGTVNEPGLLVPRYLQDHGVARVVAPLPTAAGGVWTTAGGYAICLYPFVEGATGRERGLTDRQWIDYGARLRQVHATAPGPDLARVMRRETFVPEWSGALRRVDDCVAAGRCDDPAARELAEFWLARRELIRTVLDRAEALGQRLARSAPPSVICHADIHTANVLVDPAGQVWFVDWDETVLAPRERDLMFVVGGISRDWVSPRDEALFFQGYGPTEVDPLALAYYRHAWAVGDIGSFGEQVCLRPDLGPVSRQEAVRLFRSLFEPGAIVELAFEAGELAGPPPTQG